MSRITGTPQAFRIIINQRGVYKKLGLARSTANNLKRAMNGKDDKNIPSLDKMEELLKKYGAIVVSEKVWLLRLKKT